MLLVLLGAESRNLVRRSDESVAPATGYLPAAEEDYDEDLAGYSADTFSLPGYSDGEELTRDTEGLTTTTAGELETTTNPEEEITTIAGGDKEESGFYTANSEHSGIVTTDPSEDTEDTEETTETSEDTEDAAEDTEETTEDKEEAAEDSESPFSLYSHLSPSIRECPGSSMEVCVAVCPGSSPRVYGACVQGCADRCPDSP